MQELLLLCTQSKLKALQWPGISLRQAKSSPAPQILSRCEQFGSEVHLMHPCVLLTLTQSSCALHGTAKLWARPPQESPRGRRLTVRDEIAGFKEMTK